MCYLINTCVYVFCKQVQINFSDHQVISLIHRNICQKESYMSKRVIQLDGNLAAPMLENITCCHVDSFI